MSVKAKKVRQGKANCPRLPGVEEQPLQSLVLTVTNTSHGTESLENNYTETWQSDPRP